MKKEEFKKVMSYFIKTMRKEVRSIIREELEILIESKKIKNNNRLHEMLDPEEKTFTYTTDSVKAIPPGAQQLLSNMKNTMMQDIFADTASNMGNFGEDTDMDDSVLQHTNQAPPAVQSALTKDYSQLMKKINQKKGK